MIEAYNFYLFSFFELFLLNQAMESKILEDKEPTQQEGMILNK
jgi:hypothetical protein